MSLDLLDKPAMPNRLYTLAQKRCFNANALNYALKLTGVIPDKKAWQRFLDIALLVGKQSWLLPTKSI